ncbi:hypothetical protein RQP46_008882 [Phenoliferia psychrophenolica]
MQAYGVEYYNGDTGLLPHSPHSLTHSPHPSPHKTSHFDPYPAHLNLPGAGQQFVAPSGGRSPYPVLETPSTFVSDHSDLHSGDLVSPRAHSPPPRIHTPVAPNASGYYSQQNSPFEPSSHAGRAMSAEPASYRQTTPGPGPSHHQQQQQQLHLSHAQSPAPGSPASQRSRSPLPAFGPTCRVIQWTPQNGEEGTQVTIVLGPDAITGAPSTIHSPASFGPGSPALSSRRSPLATPQPITRRFVVLFGQVPAPTKFTRANAIDGNGVGTSMASGPDEQDAFVVLTTFVPARQSMGPHGERVMVVVQVVDDHSRVLEECIVGEWEANSIIGPVTPPRLSSLKRPGDDLESHRESPGLRSPARSHHGSPMVHQNGGAFLSPSMSSQLLSPRPQSRARSTTPGGSEVDSKPQSASLRHPPLEGAQASQPDLLRTSQIPSGPVATSFGGASVATYSNKAVLKLQGDLNQMAMGWSNEEWTNRRRLIQFWRHQEGNVINATFRPIAQNEHVVNSIAISCIFRDEWNECFVTSVDTIYLLEALVGVRFTVEEKNRIRRNLEGFKPMTVSKSKVDSEPFFKLIMGFPNPKPRNIEKDVKVFPWKVLSSALKKIIGKYSATYSAPVEGSSPSLHIGGPGDEANSGVPSSQHLSVNPSGSGDPYSLPHSPQLASSALHSPQISASALHSPQIGGSRSAYGSQAPESPTGDGRSQSHHLSPSPIITTISDMSTPYPTRPNTSFDYQLESSTFSTATSSAPPTGSTSHAYASGPPDAYPASGGPIFPAAEDYGVTSEGASSRLAAPPLNHSRSYSEGPRRGSVNAPHFDAAGGYSFTPAGGTEFYAPSWDDGEGSARRGSDGWKSGAGQGPYGEPRRTASTDDQPYQGPTTVAYAQQDR